MARLFLMDIFRKFSSSCVTFPQFLLSVFKFKADNLINCCKMFNFIASSTPKFPFIGHSHGTNERDVKLKIIYCALNLIAFCSLTHIHTKIGAKQIFHFRHNTSQLNRVLSIVVVQLMEKDFQSLVPF